MTTFSSGGSTDTVFLGGGTTPAIQIDLDAGPQIAQIIELATGNFPSSSQIAGWVGYESSGGSLASIATAFISSTAFADTYNGGTPVDPNSPITPVLSQEIITHALGSASAGQVNAWTATGLSVAQVFQNFALGDQFSTLEGAQNSTFLPEIGIRLTGSETVNFHATPSPIVLETGDITGATTSGGTSTAGIAIPTLMGTTGGIELLFDNAPTETFVGEVNVASANSLAQALDLAATTASSSESGGLIPADTGVLNWFQFGGDTFVVEAINPTTTATEQTALTATDAVVSIVGSVDLSSTDFSSHTLTI